MNQIRDSLLGLMTRAKRQPILEEARKQKTARLILSAILYIACAASLLAFALNPPRAIHVEGEFQVSRCSFYSSDADELKLEKSFSNLTLHNMSQLRFNEPVDSLLGDMDFDETFELNLSGGRSAKITEGSSGNTSLRLGPVSLEELIIADSAKITLTQHTEGRRYFQWAIRQKDTLHAVLSYEDSLQIISDFIDLQIERWDGSGPQDEAFTLKAYHSDPSEMNVSFLPRNASMEMRFKENAEYTTSVKIEGLNFLMATGADIQSSILGGVLTIREPEKEIFREVTFEPRKRLEMVEKEPFEISSIRLSDTGIFIKFNADLKQVYTYINSERVDLRPKLYQWLWHNHKEITLTISALVLAFLIFGPGLLTRRFVPAVNRIVP